MKNPEENTSVQPQNQSQIALGIMYHQNQVINF
jgi:hypothetical protein